MIYSQNWLTDWLTWVLDTHSEHKPALSKTGSEGGGGGGGGLEQDYHYNIHTEWALLLCLGTVIKREILGLL